MSQDFFEEGGALQRAGHLCEAIAAYERALQDDPESYRAQTNLGVALEASGRVEEALLAYQRALAINPDVALIHYNLGHALHSQDDLEGAITSYRRALELDPDSVAIHFNLGNALWHLGEVDEAIASYERAIDLDPDSHQAHSNLGTVLSHQGRMEESARALRRAVEIKPAASADHFSLGCVLEDLERSDEAAECYRRALEFDSGMHQAHSQLGALLFREGQLEESAEAYRQAVELNPAGPADHYNLGIVRENQGRLDEAIEAFGQSLRRNPASRVANEHLARALFRTYRVTEALDVLDRWLMIMPDDPIALHLQAAFTGKQDLVRASRDYVRDTFDLFAADFDVALERVGYRGPALIEAAMAATAGAARAELEILEVGCGTGLCGPCLRPYAHRLAGVDLSVRMLDKARERGVYDELHDAELTEFLSARAQDYDVIVSADTFIYFGDLGPVFAAAAAALRVGGVLIFTVEHLTKTGEQTHFRLNPHGRYSHTESYLRSALAEAGLAARTVSAETLRHELGEPIAGLIVVATRVG